ncbi:LysR substrate-binding domain-containing protein [Paraburkholderia phenoliruptrix]|uniref:LysR substrate-binding domain-containing protein n=1 Tax=Paraburkholderia phenoliruptrix TaxID=252970 RepID=UPI002869E8CC|nr:LysR substrate-binding domain-containing protein [Paraburkholderia phenoliruptrix]WMY11770.1 LysR substrate-binding domain-containing protein [Paraburkholderia phenoliruptrix]
MNWLDRVPFPYLRNFEAAGRTGSFAEAAEELHLSPSAVSHSVRRLEEVIGLRLFHRSARDVELSPEGAVLLEYIQRAMEEMRRGFSILGNDEATPLRLHTAPSFATQWLLPRLSRFVKAYPNIDLRFSASADYGRFENGELDLDIVYGEPKPSPYETVPLVVEGLAPLCSAELAQTIEKPDDLLKHTLIQCDAQRFQWKGWFELNGLTPPVRYGLRFDRSAMAIAAAADGLGVVLESTLLAEREIKSGALVRPLTHVTRELQYIGHYLMYPKRLHYHYAFETFKNWLLSELGLETTEAPAPSSLTRR